MSKSSLISPPQSHYLCFREKLLALDVGGFVLLYLVDFWGGFKKVGVFFSDMIKLNRILSNTLLALSAGLFTGGVITTIIWTEPTIKVLTLAYGPSVLFYQFYIFLNVADTEENARKNIPLVIINIFIVLLFIIYFFVANGEYFDDWVRVRLHLNLPKAYFYDKYSYYGFFRLTFPHSNNKAQCIATAKKFLELSFPQMVQIWPDWEELSKKEVK